MLWFWGSLPGCLGFHSKCLPLLSHLSSPVLPIFLKYLFLVIKCVECDTELGSAPCPGPCLVTGNSGTWALERFRSQNHSLLWNWRLQSQLTKIRVLVKSLKFIIWERTSSYHVEGCAIAEPGTYNKQIQRGFQRKTLVNCHGRVSEWGSSLDSIPVAPKQNGLDS